MKLIKSIDSRTLFYVLIFFNVPFLIIHLIDKNWVWVIFECVTIMILLGMYYFSLILEFKLKRLKNE
jgi:hypothetical protein